MNATQCEFSLDWLRASFNHSTHAEEVLGYGLGFHLDDTALQAAKFYTHAIGYSLGGRFDWNAENYEQGALLTATGRDLARWREYRLDLPEVVLRRVVGYPGARVTRLDLAADIYAPGASPQHIWHAWHDGRIKTRISKIGRIETYKTTGRKGLTVTLGSRQSPRFLRVYDKAGEQGIKDLDWVRVELEVKYRHAPHVAKHAVEQGAMVALLHNLDDLLQVRGVRWWDDLMNGEFSPPDESVPGRKVTNDEGWLHAVALKKVVEAILAGDEICKTHCKMALDAID